jgi:hypothetical protein
VKTHSLPPLLAALALAVPLPAQTYVVVNKGIHYVQTDSTTVSPEGATPYSVVADISGSGLSASVPTGPNRFTPPTATAYPLAYSAERSGWNYESPDLAPATLDSLYPNGTWALEAGGNTWNLALTGNLYPNAPVATFSAGTWTGGRLLLSAAEAAAGFSVTTSAFTTNYSAGNSFVGLSIGSIGTDNAPTFTTSALTLNVAGGALAPGTHRLGIDFNRLMVMDDSVAGYIAIVGYNTNTNVTIEVQGIPEPSAFAAVAGALGLVGAALRRRRAVTSA